jgi:predicted dehydrogenase
MRLLGGGGGVSVRWGILGTANIAARAFLPALREAGGGTAVAVAGRDRSRAAGWAAEHGVAEGIEGYAELLAREDVDAVYIPLPNSLHARWTEAALERGKAVLCEKPLCVTPDETERVLAAAGGPLWEAFVFPFHPQTALLRELLADIGELREIQSAFHFRIGRPDNIRLDPLLGGGALYDVGCYPVRLARLLFDAEPASGTAITTESSGVDAETVGMLDFPGGRRLVLSCGFGRAYDTFTRLLCTDGEIRVSNAFHPGPGDTVEVWRDGRREQDIPAPEGTAFSWGIRHVHEVLSGSTPPRHLARDDALGNARALQLLYDSLRG